MTRDEWINYGIEHEWVVWTCMAHDGWNVMTPGEVAGFDEGDDPCVPRWIVTPEKEI